MKVTDEQMAPTMCHAFLDQRLSGAGSVLIAADDNLHTDHLPLLREALARHEVGTLAVEMPQGMNVLFWAYRDGLMEAELGSKQAAQHYLRQMLLTNIPQQNLAYANGMADAILAMLDKGGRVVAFSADAKGGYLATRDSLEQRLLADEIHWEYRRQATLKSMKPEEFATLLRQQQNGMLDKVMTASTQAAAHKLFPHYEEQVLDELRAELETARLRDEIEHWITNYAEQHKGCAATDGVSRYEQRLKTMQQLARYCFDAGAGVDAASAAVLAACMDRDKPVLALTHFSRIDGMGLRNPGATDAAEGIFAEHLAAAMKSLGVPAPEVTKAVIGTKGLHDAACDWLDTNAAVFKGKPVRSEIETFDIVTGKNDQLPMLTRKQQEFGEKFKGNWLLGTKRQRSLAMNPLSEIGILHKAQEVAASMHEHTEEPAIHKAVALTAEECEEYVKDLEGPPPVPLADSAIRRQRMAETLKDIGKEYATNKENRRYRLVPKQSFAEQVTQEKASGSDVAARL